MKVSKTVNVESEVLEYVVCDRCKRKFDNDMDLQEFHFINFLGGFTSVFGDMVEVECDLCQHCLHELIKDFYREVI